VDEARRLAAFDSGIFHAGLFREDLRADENLCPEVIRVAREGRVRVLLPNTVLDELHRRAVRDGWQARLDAVLGEFLEETEAQWGKRPTPEEIAAAGPALLALLRHEADVAIAVEVAQHRPDYFVHTNKRHWGPQLNEALGGVQVVSPREFLLAVGAPVPARRRRR